MIRNLKILLVGAMALAAIGVTGPSAAQAAEEGKFHCSVPNCTVTLKPDGVTGKEKHHVLVISDGTHSASATCNEITGSATSATKTTKEVTLTGIGYHSCTLAGSPASVDMNSCDYLFTDSGQVHLKCTIAGEGIVISTGSCKVGIEPQTPSSVSYMSINSKKEITASPKVVNIVASVQGCAGLGLPDGDKTYNKSEYSTGNTTVHSTGNSVWFE